MSARTVRLLAVTVLAVGAGAGCAAIPADPEGTLERATGGILRVGMSEHSPWTELENGERAGVEVELEAGALDVVIGGLTEKSPWVDQAALTRPYVVVTSPSGSPEPHVMASRMGENALLVALERFLEDRETEVAELVDGEEP